MSHDPSIDTSTSTRGQLALGSYIRWFLLSCWVSLLVPVVIVHSWFSILDPAGMVTGSGNWAWAVVAVILGVVLGYWSLLGWSWFVAKAGLWLVTRGKPIPEGKFVHSYTSQEWREFSLRHVAKKFSMWLFEHHAPRFVYRKYVGSFITIGKHVELPKWVPMECCEIGDNTVFARQAVVTSHLIDGDTMTVKKVSIGKNCIIDAIDETRRVCIFPGAIIGDNVIIKAGTFVAKDTVLESGGIYEGDLVVKRVGNVSDLAPAELERMRREVRGKARLASTMLDDWSRFTSRVPRLVVMLGTFVGWAGGFTLTWMWLAMVLPWLSRVLGLVSVVVNVLMLPWVVFIAYGLVVFLPVPVILATIKRYGRGMPRVSREPGASVSITDMAVIDRWKKWKWLKWQAIDRVNTSLFLDTSMLVYQRIGDNDVGFKTVLYVSKIDTDNVSIGDNTVLSFGCHVYAYTLQEGEKPVLVLKRTSIGNDCILGSSQVMAGASIGDRVVLGYHTVVPEDNVLASGKIYAGNPAMEFDSFLELRRKVSQDGT